jgi:branched-chain amino acid transport system ATP-binding protein
MSGPPILETRGLSAGYGVRPVIHEVDIQVGAGEVVALLGANGVGKTTTLLAITGELPIAAGEVLFDGSSAAAPLHRRAREGLAFVPEGRSVFFGMSVADNLRAARVATADAVTCFPELEKRLTTRAGLISGGEQQMLSLARALGRRPRLIIVDELSLGLAPKVVRRLLAALRTAADEGAAVLFVEQHARKAMAYSDRVYVMNRGRISLSGEAGSMASRLSEIEDAYLAERRKAPQSGPA